jgi:hypothetical protein
MLKMPLRIIGEITLISFLLAPEFERKIPRGKEEAFPFYRIRCCGAASF